jgi:glycosyltransferase involved in cell wall biosynthesis
MRNEGGLVSTPLVSILIPCYNAERWIAACIESALQQSWPNKEVIVLDDGSTDGSLDIIRGFDGRIRWEAGPNRGGNAARNRLLELAQGEWLQYLDADDWLKPEKVANQMRFVASHPETDVVYGPVQFQHMAANGSREEIEEIPAPHDPWTELASWKLPQTGGSLWRKQAILAAGGWKEDQPCCQEHELYLRLLTHGARFGFSADNGAVYRQWSDQTVCRRDPRRTMEQRLLILDRLEHTLAARRELTAARQDAVNVARFEIARMLWQQDEKAASDLMTTTRRAHPAFKPHGRAAPAVYRLVFHLFGFRAAERVASWKRAILGHAEGSPVVS